MAVNYGTSIVTDGLLMLADAANTRSYPGSGTSWTDLSGNGNTFSLTALGTVYGMPCNTPAIGNTGLGYGALANVNTSACQNTAVGINALGANTSGCYNVAVGANVLVSNTSGGFNVGIGAYSLPSCACYLVDMDSVSVHLTSIGRNQGLYVADITGNYVEIGASVPYIQLDAYYSIYAERADVDKLVVEI